MSGITFADLLGTPPATPRWPDAQAMELQERFDRMHHQHRFSNGDLVIYRYGFDMRPAARTSLPMLVVRANDGTFPDWRIDMRDPRVPMAFAHNVVLMDLTDDGTAVFFWADDFRLEPWPRRGAEPLMGETAP